MPFGYTKQPVKAVVTSPTRAIGTIYQNTTGRPIIVIASALCVQGVETDNAYIGAYIGTVSPPATLQLNAGLRSMASGSPKTEYAVAIFCVPNDYYYKIDKVEGGSGTVALNKWREVEL